MKRLINSNTADLLQTAERLTDSKVPLEERHNALAEFVVAHVAAVSASLVDICRRLPKWRGLQWVMTGVSISAVVGLVWTLATWHARLAHAESLTARVEAVEVEQGAANERLARIEAQLDLLLKHFGIDPLQGRGR